MRGANSEPRHRPDVPSWRWPFDKASDLARRSTDADAEERRGGVAEESAPDRITARPINFPRRDINHPPASRQAADFDALRRSRVMSTDPTEN